jgi:pyruvate dehydrogenase (quinone)/pyruvate oxidase
MTEIDTLFMVGTNFPYTKHLPEPGKVRTVQIEADPVRAGARMPTEVPVVGDAKEGLQALLPLLHRRTDRAFLEDCQENMDRWRLEMASLQNVERDPIAPEYLISLVDRHATDDAILTCDSGTIATWAARHWTIRGDREFYLSGNLATMAPGLPYAIAAQLAYPGRQCIAFVGDGGFAMLMAEFLTAARHGLPVKVVINNNGAYGQILWEQVALGYPEFGVRHQDSTVVQGFADYSPWARSCGAYGVKVTSPGDLDEAVREALAHPGPALVDCNVNADEPPMPGKIEYAQAKGFAEAFLHGQPHKTGIVRTLVADTAEKLRS